MHIWFLLFLIFTAAITGCATSDEVVQGFINNDGPVYRETEQEEFGARSTVKVRGMEF